MKSTYATPGNDEARRRDLATCSRAELLATSCSPTLTHIDNHLTPCDTYLITISGRTSSTCARLPNYRILIFSRTHAIHSMLSKVSWARYYHAQLTVASVRENPPQPQLDTTASFRGAKHTTSECPDIVRTDLPVTLYQNLIV